MRSVFASAVVFLALMVFPTDQDRALTPQHMELPSRYPNVARAARLQGTITVNLTVSGGGTVIAADANSPDAQNAGAAGNFKSEPPKVLA